MPSKQATASPARKAATAPKRADVATTTGTSAKKNGASKSTEHAASLPKQAKAVKVVNVSSILVTHAAPSDENSPYHQIQRQYGVKFDFQNFIEIAGVPTPEFRKQNIHPLEYTAVIFTSKHSVDHFFRICRDLRIEMPAEAKYFCVSDSTAKYLQKYITIRKRKLFVGERSTADLIPLVKKHTTENYLLPGGESSKSDLTDFMIQNGYSLKEAMVYSTVYCDLSKLKLTQYDMICFFSPTSVLSLSHNFPQFQQKSKLVAVFGKSTAKAAEQAGLRIDIEAPRPNTPSMTMAIEQYLNGSYVA
jgi:uroporphyrinogen-III synthase